MAWDGEAVRARSRAELERFGLEVNPNLPLLGADEVAQARPVAEVVARCQALYGVLAVVEDVPPGEVLPSLGERGLTRWLTEQERAFLEDPSDEEALTQLSWRTEGMRSMGWALRLFDDLPLTGTAGEVAPPFDPIDPDGSAGGPDPSLALRPAEELGERLDLFYCAHWCVRHHELTGEPEAWPEEIEPGAVWERRHGLEFLFADTDDWDEISLDT